MLVVSFEVELDEFDDSTGWREPGLDGALDLRGERQEEKVARI